MNALPRVCAVLSLGLAAGPALGQAGPTPTPPAPSSPAPSLQAQPPMNAFDQAFYRCDGGEAFMMSYDSEQPATAEMTVNSENRRYKLKRSASPAGVAFAGGGARFWTDGRTVTVEGTKATFHNCRIKAG